MIEKGVLALKKGVFCVREGRVCVREGRVCVIEGPYNIFKLFVWVSSSSGSSSLSNKSTSSGSVPPWGVYGRGYVARNPENLIGMPPCMAP